MLPILSENTMYQILKPHVPEGETLQAAIHVVGLECKFFQIFSNCQCDEESLIIKPGEGAIGMAKGKYATYDAYLGITEKSLLLCDYPVCKYFYGFEHFQLSTTEGSFVVEEESDLRDYGKCFSLDSITSVSIKKGLLNNKKGKIEFGDYGYAILSIPNMAGFGNGMPHHKEYKEKILARLEELNK